MNFINIQIDTLAHCCTFEVDMLWTLLIPTATNVKISWMSSFNVSS